MNKPESFKRIRQRASYTQAQLAKLLGISVRSVEAMEQGKRGISDEIMGRLKEVTKV